MWRIRVQSSQHRVAACVSSCFHTRLSRTIREWRNLAGNCRLPNVRASLDLEARGVRAGCEAGNGVE